MIGSTNFSVKYDLGGYILQYSTLIELIQSEFNCEVIQGSLNIFNLSHLSTVAPILRIYPKENQPPFVIQIDHESLDFEVFLDEVGILTIWIHGKKIDSDNIIELKTHLLNRYHLFVDEKNKDYIPYLKSYGTQVWKNSLKYREFDDSSSKDLFRSLVEKIRAICNKISITKNAERTTSKSFKPRLGTYIFHDFRTIFEVPRILFESEEDANTLLFLELPNSKKNFVTSEGQIKTANEIKSSVWAFITTDLNSFTNVHLFHYAHNYWFISQVWIFLLREYFQNNDNEWMAFSKKQIQDKLLGLQNEKNSLFKDMIAINNSDLVLKSTKYNYRFRYFIDSLNLSEQLNILEKQLSHIKSYLDQIFDFLEFENQNKSERSSQVLEILFALNTTAGITSIVPSIFSSDVSETIKLDLPRYLSFAVLLLTSIVYLIVFLARKRSK